MGELTYPIEHCILTAVPTELSRIKTFYAHPQVFQPVSYTHLSPSDVGKRPRSSTRACTEGSEPVAQLERVGIKVEVGLIGQIQPHLHSP